MFEIILGNTLIKQNNTIQINKLNNFKAVGLYFSSSKCSSCNVFTMMLKSTYPELIKNDIEIIFISSDDNINEFNEYYKKMPWLALPYENRNIKKKLCTDFSIIKIPQLIFINQELDILTKKGLDFIYNNLDYSFSNLETFDETYSLV